MKNFFLKVNSILFVFLLITEAALSQHIFPFQNPELPIDERINDLIRRLTVEEKAAMMLYNSPEIKRLNIPEYNWWNESLHGVGRAGKATVFPQAIGLAATFNEELIFQVATAISDEARAKHQAAVAKGNREQYTGLTFWTPNINILRDPRWGRGQETYGEDPVLTARLGVQFVKGMQGNHPYYLKTSACAKHFAVHSGPEKTRHEFNAVPDETDFRETYLYAFRELVNAGVESVMCAYNQLNGTGCCANSVLLNNILRKEWEFKGHIVSDCWALNDFITHQKSAETGVDAAVMAMNAGVNLNCGMIYKYINQALREGKITEEKIDELLGPLLKTRFKLGLFDAFPLSPYANISDTVVNCIKHIELAYKTAVQSIVLLQNKNNALPLNLSSLKKIFVSGPTANDNTVLVGNYNGFSGNMVTLLEGIINKVDAGTVVDFAQGTFLNTDSLFHGFYTAQNSDVIIVGLGNSLLLEGEEGDAMLSDNGGDRKDLKLPENQLEYLRMLRNQFPETKIITVITGGSAIAVNEIEKLSDAVLFAWYPGEQGGNAIADIIFGNQNPSGRLPLTFYEKTEDLPPFDNYSMKNRTYRFYKGKPHHPFGFGLSYTTFHYSNMEVFFDKKTNNFQVQFTIKNTGTKEGQEVVQLYVCEKNRDETRPMRSLKDFKRISLKPGEEKTVSFVLKKEALQQWDKSKAAFIVKKGIHIFEIGASSADIRLLKEMDMTK